MPLVLCFITQYECTRGERFSSGVTDTIRDRARGIDRPSVCVFGGGGTPTRDLGLCEVK